MKNVEFKDLQRIHHEAGLEQRDAAWDQVFVTCLGCNLMIEIRGAPLYLIPRIPTSTPSPARTRAEVAA